MKATKLTKDFTINGECHQFMYLIGAKTREDLKPYIALVKGQGDYYRITKWAGGYELWDARP